MAETLQTACPACSKSVRYPAAAAGKKVRCPACKQVFATPAADPLNFEDEPAPKPKPKASNEAAFDFADEPKPKPKPKPVAAKMPDSAPIAFADDPPKKKPVVEEDEENSNPYGVVKVDDDMPRCPFCALEMPSREAIICINCGYNTRTRQRTAQTTVLEHTGNEKFIWLLPGIICAIVVVMLIVLDILLIVNMERWLAGSFLWDDEEKKFYIKPGAFSLYCTFAIIGMIIPLGKFAYKRLAVNNKPPEKFISK